MWLYSFQWRYGHDKICRSEQSNFWVGDLLVGKSDMFLVLGENIARKSDKEKFSLAEELTEHHKGFFSKQAIELIHWLVRQYYTSYKNVIKIFVSGELADLFKKEIAVKKKVEQSLIVFPDVRTMDNYLKKEEKNISELNYVILNSTSTQQQKDKARRWIKMGHIHTLLCTPSEVFQDRKDLKYITLMDSHQWYYKNQQDPRYDTREFIKKMAEIYGAELTLKWVNIFA